MSEAYERALADAEVELAELEKQSTRIEQRKAQLKQTIIGLKALMGRGFGAEEQSLTSSIRLVLKATDDFLTVQEVIDRLRMVYPNFIPGTNKVSTVTTLLNRLARDKQIVQDENEDRRVTYAWNRSPEKARLIDQIRAAQAKKK